MIVCNLANGNQSVPHPNIRPTTSRHNVRAWTATFIWQSVFVHFGLDGRAIEERGAYISGRQLKE